MAWSNTQKGIAAAACKAVGLNDQQRLMMLGSFPAARHQGRVTSTAPHLSQKDFEQYMGLIEAQSGGQIQTKSKAGEFRFSSGYWQGRADGDARGGEAVRLRYKVQRLVDAMAAKLESWRDPESALAGWIANRVTQGAAIHLDKLDLSNLRNLLHGLSAYAKRNGVTI